MNNEALNNQFKAIYERESDNIFRFCLLRVTDREQAMDLTQETFTRLWQSLQGGKKMTNERAFLFTVAHRLIIDWYRKKKSLRLETFTDPDTGEEYDVADEGAAEHIVEGAEGKMLIDALEKLSPSYKQAIYLRFVEGLAPQEIAEVLGISANATSVRITRGLEELRKIKGYSLDPNETPIVNK
jgi:RNA polymerase sigma-70 factor (ECF subfamily)